jgi:hypothetical protein
LIVREGGHKWLVQESTMKIMLAPEQYSLGRILLLLVHVVLFSP